MAISAEYRSNFAALCDISYAVHFSIITPKMTVKMVRPDGALNGAPCQE